LTDYSDRIRKAVSLLLSARHAVALTGAGVSTPSGIPDFRSPDSGLWSRANPLVVASILGFRLHPAAFYEWVHPLAHLFFMARPNPAHCALAELECLGLLQTVITQNIDNLHQAAGSRRVLELHGHLREATCTRCYRVVPAQRWVEKFLADGEVPYCECGGVMKPNIILFGEQLPVNVLIAARREAQSCDLMLIAGSSLEMAPASDLPLLALRRKARLIIVNHQPTHLDHQADLVIHDDVAEILPSIVTICREAHSSSGTEE
jgi:NAD-dependent deacetylase